MPLPIEAEQHLVAFGDNSDGFALFGIALNPESGEMCTFSSHGMEPGAVLGFLQRAVEQMVTAAANNELEYIGGANDTPVQSQGSIPSAQTAARGGKIGLVH